MQLEKENEHLKCNNQELTLRRQKIKEKLLYIRTQTGNFSTEAPDKKVYSNNNSDNNCSIDKSYLKIIFNEIENLYKEIIPVLFCENVYLTMKAKSILIENKLNLIKSSMKELIEDIHSLKYRTSSDTNCLIKSNNVEKNSDLMIKHKHEYVNEKFPSLDSPSENVTRLGTNREKIKKSSLLSETSLNKPSNKNDVVILKQNSKNN